MRAASAHCHAKGVKNCLLAKILKIDNVAAANVASAQLIKTHRQLCLYAAN
jgi:hypothetical protein